MCLPILDNLVPVELDPFKLSQFGHSKIEALNNIIFYKKTLVVESTVSLSQRQ